MVALMVGQAKDFLNIFGQAKAAKDRFGSLMNQILRT